MPCNPLDINIDLPTGPTGSPIPGFGTPFTLPLPNIADLLSGFPEDLLDLFNKLQMLIPPGALKPPLSVNFGKDILDSILSLLDKFFPFLMLYKFFLPILNIIICIIEVLCAMQNPFKLIRAIRRLFRNCIPDFLNLFPIFAIIIMIISLLLLILALIEYIIAQILKLINALLRNINALHKAFSDNDKNSVMAIAKKLGSLLCIFQNLFVLLAIFNVVIQIIKDILALSFAIPPCDNTDNTDADGCCTTDVCPAIVQSNYTNKTGTFQYLSQVETSTTIPNFNVVNRTESWQLFDTQQTIPQAFINIVDGYDVIVTPKPVFFPTDATYSAATAPKQAAYTVDLRLFYDPVNWGRLGVARNIRFTNCIITKPPTRNLNTFNNGITTENNGVVILAGGLGFEDDGTTVLTGFAADGVTPISNQATLENFLHRPTNVFPTTPTFAHPDGYTFQDVEYTFKPNQEVLINKNIITIGCEPTIALDRGFINSVFAGDVAVKTQELGNLINGPNFSNPGAAQECLSTALTNLRTNMTADGVAQFQATANACLQKLKDDTSNSLNSMITLGTDACQSNFTLSSTVQFTTKPIIVTANLNERNGLSLTTGLSPDVGASLAAKLKAHITFGEVTNFIYDGTQSFTANITSNVAGSGQAMLSFDDNTFCTNTIPADNTVNPTHTLQTISYSFVYTSPVTDGKPRRDEGDLAREGENGGDS